MIRSITRQKPKEEIDRLLEGLTRLFVVGCGTCVTLTRTGGADQVRAMAEALGERGKLVTGELVLRTILRCISTGSAVLAVPVHDTVRRVVHEFATEVVDRKKLYLIQTPQAFRFDTIMEAYHRGRERLEWPTDDASLVEKLGEEINLVEGSVENIKITTPDDLLLAEAIIARRRSRPEGEDGEGDRLTPGE